MNYSKLDKNIRRLVKFLNKKGIETTSSCEGGDGHGFKFPTVIVNPNWKPGELDLHDTRRATAVALLKFGLEGFTISETYNYQGSQKPWKPTENNLIKVELWSKSALLKLLKKKKLKKKAKKK